jgi:hypothetical protein
MKQFVFTAECSDYEFFLEIKGESIDDPAMHKKVVEWIAGLGDGMVYDQMLNEDREEAPSITRVKGYEVAQEVNTDQFAFETFDYITESQATMERNRKQQQEQQERETLAHLQRKYQTP